MTSIRKIALFSVLLASLPAFGAEDSFEIEMRCLSKLQAILHYNERAVNPAFDDKFKAQACTAAAEKRLGLGDRVGHAVFGAPNNLHDESAVLLRGTRRTQRGIEHGFYTYTENAIFFTKVDKNRLMVMNPKPGTSPDPWIGKILVPGRGRKERLINLQVYPAEITTSKKPDEAIENSGILFSQLRPWRSEFEKDQMRDALNSGNVLSLKSEIAMTEPLKDEFKKIYRASASCLAPMLKTYQETVAQQGNHRGTTDQVAFLNWLSSDLGDSCVRMDASAGKMISAAQAEARRIYANGVPGSSGGTGGRAGGG